MQVYIEDLILGSLRRKNRLMRSGRIEEADGIARLIGKKIARWNSVQLKSINSKTDQKDMWKRVKQFSNRGCTRTTRSNLTATQLNDHYARISTDSKYLGAVHKVCHAIFYDF